MKRLTHSRTFLFLIVIALLLSIAIAEVVPGSVRAQSGTQAATAAAQATLGPTPTAMPLSGDPILIGVAVAQTTDTALLGQEQVVGCAEPHFRLVSSISGRLDYIETINRWNARIGAPSFGKTLLKLLRDFLPKS